MTMLKRILAVTLSAAMIGAVLTGCSNDKEPGEAHLPQLQG